MEVGRHWTWLPDHCLSSCAMALLSVLACGRHHEALCTLHTARLLRLTAIHTAQRFSVEPNLHCCTRRPAGCTTPGLNRQGHQWIRSQPMNSCSRLLELEVDRVLHGWRVLPWLLELQSGIRDTATCTSVPTQLLQDPWHHLPPAPIMPCMPSRPRSALHLPLHRLYASQPGPMGMCRSMSSRTRKAPRHSTPSFAKPQVSKTAVGPQRSSSASAAAPPAAPPRPKPHTSISESLFEQISECQSSLAELLSLVNRTSAMLGLSHYCAVMQRAGDLCREAAWPKKLPKQAMHSHPSLQHPLPQPALPSSPPRPPHASGRMPAEAQEQLLALMQRMDPGLQRSLAQVSIGCSIYFVNPSGSSMVERLQESYQRWNP